MKRYWIGVASRDHVLLGVAGGFAQLCHGKATALRRMKMGDGLIYYSSKYSMGQSAACQCFTAIGEVADEEVYLYQMSESFKPYRRNIQFYPVQEAEIRPLLGCLSFIQDTKHWGYVFRFGHLEITQQDFELIAEAMQASL